MQIEKKIRELEIYEKIDLSDNCMGKISLKVMQNI